MFSDSQGMRFCIFIRCIRREARNGNFYNSKGGCRFYLVQYASLKWRHRKTGCGDSYFAAPLNVLDKLVFQKRVDVINDFHSLHPSIHILP